MKIEISIFILTFNNKAVKVLKTEETTQDHITLLDIYVLPYNFRNVTLRNITECAPNLTSKLFSVQ